MYAHVGEIFIISRKGRFDRLKKNVDDFATVSS